MKADHFFNTYLFQQLCAKYPLQNVLYSPINMALFAHFNNDIQPKISVNNFKNYVEHQLEIAQLLQQEAPGFFKISAQQDIPYKININWSNIFIQSKYDMFHSFKEGQRIQRFLTNDENFINTRISIFQAEDFFAIRLNNGKQSQIDLYVPSSEEAFISFPNKITPNSLAAWGERFHTTNYSNLKVPAFDIDFDYQLQDQWKNETILKSNFAAWKTRIGHDESPIDVGGFRGGINDYGRIKIIDVDRPFYLIIHAPITNTILQIAAIVEPFEKKKQSLELVNHYHFSKYFEPLVKPSIIGNLAIQYWCLEQLIDLFSIKELAIANYLKLLKKCVTHQKYSLEIIKELDKASEELVFNGKNISEKTEQIKMLIKFAQDHSLEDFHNEKYYTFLTSEEFANQTGTYYYLDAVAKNGILLPNINCFNQFGMLRYPHFGTPIPDFDFSKIKQISPVVPKHFIQKQFKDSRNYTTFRLLKAAWWDYSIKEKLEKALACMDWIVQQENINEEEWGKMRLLIIKAIDLEKQEGQKDVLAYLNDYTQIGTKDLTGWEPEFKYLNPQIEQRIFELKKRHPFLYGQMVMFGYIHEQHPDWSYNLAYRFFENHLDAGYNFPFEITTEKVVPDFTP